MYKPRMTDAYFRGELDKFIQAAENHARNKNTQRIPCPCKICKNMRVFSDTTQSDRMCWWAVLLRIT
jgi:hypothetical protein